MSAQSAPAPARFFTIRQKASRPGRNPSEIQKSGDTVSQKTIGGKQVEVQTSGTTSSYFYFAGDAVLFAAANNETDAASVIQQLP